MSDKSQKKEVSQPDNKSKKTELAKPVLATGTGTATATATKPVEEIKQPQPQKQHVDPKKLEALKATLGQIEKQFGKGAILRLGDNQQMLEIECIPTGSMTLDLALGGKGIPRGRVCEVYGPEGSGKTSLCLTVVANVQKRGGIAAYIDVEHAIDPQYAKKLGVDLEELYMSQPNSGEEALEITDMLVRSNSVDVVVVDSVAALVTKAELEGEMGDQHIGLQARLMSQALRKLTATISKSKTCVIFINQLREKIGMMMFQGPNETTPGGRALKFYASVRIDIRRIGALKEGDVQIGTRVKCKIAKNKIAPPFKQGEFDLLFDSGISYEGDLIDLGEIYGVVSRSGAWVIYKDEKIGQGKEKARQYLKENPKVAADIAAQIKQKYAEANKA